MKIWGQTDVGENIYELTDTIGVTENGEVLALDDMEASIPTKTYLIDLPQDYDLSSSDAADYCKKHIIDLEAMPVDGYLINLVENTIQDQDGSKEVFNVVNIEDDLDDDEPEIVEYKGLTMRVYLDGSVDISYKNAINNERNGGGIDVKDTVKALAELPQNLEKNMLVIAKALRNEVDAYIPFEKADVKS